MLDQSLKQCDDCNQRQEMVTGGKSMNRHDDETKDSIVAIHEKRKHSRLPNPSRQRLPLRQYREVTSTVVVLSVEVYTIELTALG
jgi:hypothetical protein